MIIMLIIRNFKKINTNNIINNTTNNNAIYTLQINQHYRYKSLTQKGRKRFSKDNAALQNKTNATQHTSLNSKDQPIMSPRVNKNSDNCKPPKQTVNNKQNNSPFLEFLQIKHFWKQRKWTHYKIHRVNETDSI